MAMISQVLNLVPRRQLLVWSGLLIGIVAVCVVLANRPHDQSLWVQLRPLETGAITRSALATQELPRSIERWFAAPIAQSLQEQGQMAEAVSWGERALGTGSDSPYRLYGAISLLMWQQQWEEALAQSRQLKEQLAPTADHPLYALNLTRMGFLAQQLGDREGELAIWQEWLATPRPQMDQLFSEGSIKLTDYVRTRL